MILILVQLSLLIVTIQAGHYKVRLKYASTRQLIFTFLLVQGGSVTWKPVDSLTNSSSVDIIVYQTHSWTLSRYPCNQALIDSLGSYLDGGSFYGEPFVDCQSSPALCTASGYPGISEPTYCTDFSTTVKISSGALIKKGDRRSQYNYSRWIYRIIVGY
jgi:hypothetical protein